MEIDMSKEKTLAELVEIRRAKLAQIAAKRAEVKLLTKEVRQISKTININLDAIVMTNTKEKISEDNYGYSTVKNVEDMKIDAVKLIASGIK
jgi:hypothetical protein